MIRYFLEWLVCRCFASGPEIIERKSVSRLLESLALVCGGMIFWSFACWIYWKIDGAWFHRYSGFWEAASSRVPLLSYTRDEQIIFLLVFIPIVGGFMGLEPWAYYRLKHRRIMKQIIRIAERRRIE